MSLKSALLSLAVVSCSGFSSSRHSLNRGSLSARGRHYLHLLAASFSSIPRSETDTHNTIKGRKHPKFPGAVPLVESDINTFICQTNQENPANAILGKPARCQCIHGYPQAFSLDPIPNSRNRLNSGLLKLTCPVLVNCIDSLEDDGSIGEINELLQNGSKSAEVYSDFMNKTHTIHSTARMKLISASAGESTADFSHQLIEDKLGKMGAQYFFKAGVAGANPEAEKPDVKCLHAWMADYIFRNIPSDSSKTINSANIHTDMTQKHPIGEFIIDKLRERNVNTAGTENCHLVCSGTRSSCTSKSGQVVFVPTPRNKQRKRSVRGNERRRRARHNAMLSID